MSQPRRQSRRKLCFNYCSMAQISNNMGDFIVALENGSESFQSRIKLPQLMERNASTAVAVKRFGRKTVSQLLQFSASVDCSLAIAAIIIWTIFAVIAIEG